MIPDIPDSITSQSASADRASVLAASARCRTAGSLGQAITSDPAIDQIR